jgi:hypothetical protein
MKMEVLHSDQTEYRIYQWDNILPSWLTHTHMLQSRIRVTIGPQHRHAYRKRPLNGVVLRMRPEKPRPRVTAGVAR